MLEIEAALIDEACCFLYIMQLRENVLPPDIYSAKEINKYKNPCQISLQCPLYQWLSHILINAETLYLKQNYAKYSK